MAREIRQIILSKDEFVDAINSYKRIVQDSFPHGEVVSYNVGEKGRLKVSMRTYYGRSQQEIAIDVDPSHVVEMLVRFCIENNIMLPRNSKTAYPIDAGMAVDCDGAG